MRDGSKMGSLDGWLPAGVSFGRKGKGGRILYMASRRNERGLFGRFGGVMRTLFRAGVSAHGR